MDKNPSDKAQDSAASRRKITSKQVVALIGVILLVLLYLVTLLVAIFAPSASGRLFWICLFSTVAIPLLIWIYTWMYGKLTRKHTFADFDLGVSGEETDSATKN
ncbi:MAG: hypothetical protein NC432_10210 [Roseburia sp.]|nr:hypothetical protein [Roseburia sp.]MCM1097269.1 hypothetical protein [Ruminococcus flavefaciens]